MLVRMRIHALNRTCAALLALLLLPVLALAAEPAPRLPADTPQERTDANSRQAHQDHLAKRGKGRIDLYFVGDSITRRWGAAEPAYRALLTHWQKSFHGWNAANFAWGGDTTQNILWRLDNGELDGVRPRVIVVMAGTNNLSPAGLPGGAEAQASDIARGIEAILDRCRKLAPEALILFLIIFVWTPPHFWSLALYRTQDYARAGLPMLPVTHGPRYTRLMIVLYTFALVAVSLLPYAIRMSGMLYLVAALVLGAVFCGYAIALYVRYSDALARRTFAYSIAYLAALFSALLVDHYWR